MEKLTFEQLQQLFKSPRTDHPARRSHAMSPSDGTSRGCEWVTTEDGKRYSRKVRLGLMIHNPRDCVGLRNVYDDSGRMVGVQ